MCVYCVVLIKWFCWLIVNILIVIDGGMMLCVICNVCV